MNFKRTAAAFVAAMIGVTMLVGAAAPNNNTYLKKRTSLQPDGVFTEIYDYDCSGNRIRIQMVDESGNVIISEFNTYNSKNKPLTTTIVDETSRTTVYVDTYTYDEKDRPLKNTHNVLNAKTKNITFDLQPTTIVTYKYNEDGSYSKLTESYSFKKLADIDFEKDSPSETVLNRYDSSGREILFTRKYVSDDYETARIESSYDKDGTKTSYGYERGLFVDKTVYEYDKDGNIAKFTRYSPVNESAVVNADKTKDEKKPIPELKRSECYVFEYNAAGKEIKKTSYNANDKRTGYVEALYDEKYGNELGWKTYTIDANDKAVLVKTEMTVKSYNYTESGAIRLYLNNSACSEKRYDSYGNCVYERTEKNGEVISSSTCEYVRIG